MNTYKTIVVDDQPEIILNLEKQLSKYGLQVQTAQNYTEGAFMIDHYYYDIAILDISLPDGNGIELFRKLRKKNNEVYTVIITGNATLENAITALNEGINAYLVKPFSDDQLHAVLRQAQKTLTLKSENRALFLEIQHNRQFYENLLNSSSEAIIVTDLDHRIQYANRSARELFNLTQDISGQQSLQEYLEDGYKILSHIQQQLIQGKPVSGYRVTIRLNAEKSLEAHLNADLLTGKTGQSEGLLINLTNPLVNDEVFSRIVRKEKLSTIVHLANSLSHEIRNPINIMFGRLQLLQEELKDQHFKNAFESIHRQIDRILNITELLEKFNFTREDSIPEKCNISKIFETILLEKKPLFNEKKVQLDCQLQRNGFLVEGNQIQFLDAFRYLLDSLLDLTPTGKKLEISGKATPHSVGSKWYEFHFVIPEKKVSHDKLFEPYQSIDMELNGLLGLGMVIMHTIFNNYGAKIETLIQNESQTLIRIRFPLFENQSSQLIGQ